MAQHPTLLDGYRVRNPCHVAGVDYKVGIPAGTPLTDVWSVNWPAPFSYSHKTSFSIYCSSANPATDSNSGTTISQNYMDNSGSGGAFYPTSACTRSLTPRVNINMGTGATISVP